MDSKIIDIANCKTCKNSLLATEYLILIIYYYQTAKTRALYESSDGPADNPPNLDGWGDYNWTIPESTVSANCQHWLPISQWLGSDQDADPKWRTGTVANTMAGMCLIGIGNHQGSEWRFWSMVQWMATRYLGGFSDFPMTESVISANPCPQICTVRPIWQRESIKWGTPAWPWK